MRSYRPYLAAALVALGTAAASPAFAVQDPEDVRFLAEGRALLEKGDFRTALIQLKKAVRSNPANPDARYELGRLEFRTGDFVAAEKDISQARENGYPVAKTSPLLASTYLAEGKFQQLLNAIPPCPDDQVCKGDVLALRARAYIALRDIDNADKESQAALDANPNSATTQVTRALVLARRNDGAGAEQIVDRILGINPKVAEALVLKGDLRRQAGDQDGAIKSYRAALEVSPRDPRLHQSLAMALMAQGQDAEARTQVDQALELAPKSVMALYLKAMLLVRAQKTAEALDTVRPVEATIAKIPQGTFLLALIHSGSNNLEEALDYATRFHAAEPDSVIGAKLLANINFRLRAFSKVITILAPMRDRLSDDAEALDLLGSAYLAEGQVTEANDLLNAAVKAHPTDPMARARLAISHTRDNSTRDDGIRELEALVKSDPKNLQIDLALVATYIGNGDYDRAIATATDMIGSQPDPSLPMTIRGSARLAKGDEQGARADFESALAKNANYVPAAVYLAELDMQAGNFDHARAMLDAILKHDPADLRALLAREQIEERANQPAAAIPFLEDAIRAHPNEMDPRVRLIQVQLNQKNQDKAALAASDLARSRPDDPTAVDIAARTLFSVGKIDDAIALYQKLQGNFPDSAPIHERYGQILTAAGKTDQAKVAFDRAISADQKYMSAWFNRVILEQKLNGLDAAMTIAEKAKLKNPDDPGAVALPGDLLLSVGKLPEAEAYFRKSFEQKPTTVAANRVFRVLVQKGDNDGADAFLGQWLQKNPNDAESRLVLADHQLARGNYVDAAAHYETVLKALPRNAAVLNNLAWTYGHQKDPRAKDVAKRAYSMAPNAPAIMDTYGFILYQGGDQRQGGDLIRRAYQANSRDPQVAYHMARVLVDAKNPTEARSILKGLVDAKTTFDGDDDAHKLYTELGGS
ncbi:XrtA/PEP-CTERM system TPR-repeat protein PrsT [Telmatospirillum sp.]|uniref:XrtA/PEP-CTERM system TPR-repeat protein PrsT n=1 Tax=Telmatospirillum sp. TaxID=2079197 RepID=UPI002843D500|nr:XrtA/PEP-CTERM system TPR-repeat protein PrsT [Telmatospirillum sp.]MDR3437880.1 PEP-CTERM system TPR-repeat protein PrsT [Telmatospirillum sp.]